MAAPTVTVLAPAANATFQTRGASYLSNAAALISGVPVTGYDLPDLLADGCAIVSTVANVGTPGANVAAAEFGNAYDHTTVLTFTAGAALGAVVGSLGVGKLVYTLPAGAQIITGSQINVGITQTGGLINANVPTVGLGHVVASGAVVVLSGTATFQSINVGKAAANCTGTPTLQTVNPTASPFVLVSEVGGVKGVFFNAAVAWAGADAGPLLSGSITLNWRTLS